MTGTDPVHQPRPYGRLRDGSPQLLVPGDPVVLRLRGEVDITRRAELDACFRRFERTRARSVVVDVLDVEFLDATGLSLLARLSVTAADRGGCVDVVDPRPAVLRVLEVTGVDGSVRVVRSGRRPGDPVAPAPVVDLVTARRRTTLATVHPIAGRRRDG